ncbi:DUF2062 domain-containing protein [Thioflexithrix psekupsensis]|uniref:ATP-binding protein n=1 Tax=Thioflexithrix psekupsensis TaxID=1570016 RepID=A0A251XBC3_9GAMM|nr:DUF2062 domain-containing protein [Thioflexithrix psekupsensis]OUD15742.1 ATP-binding protein [Thioflexithrix psekupsensis]
MAKKFFKRWLPNSSLFKTHPKLQFLGTLLHQPNLWHFNRNSLSGAAAVGLFCAFLPVPMQMLVAAVLAVLFRVNLPLSVSLVWLTNPITIPPIFYFSYRLGCFLLGTPPQFEAAGVKLSLEWILSILDEIWWPLLLGSLVMSVVAAILGYFTVQFLWRLHVNQSWRLRRIRQANKKSALPPQNNPTS